MRHPRFRLWTLMIVVAVAAFFLAIAVPVWRMLMGVDGQDDGHGHSH